MRRRNYEADLEELAAGYQEARDYEFNIQFNNFLEELSINEPTTEDDIQGFMDSFTFPDETEWCTSEYESRRDSFEDAKYEEEKDRRMGI